MLQDPATTPTRNEGRRWPVARDLALSLLVLVAVLASVELALRTQRVFETLPIPRPYFTYDVTRRLANLERLQRERGRVDVLFLGSSVVRAGVDPTTFNARLKELGSAEMVSFNGAFSSMFPAATRYYLEHVWLDAARPRFVLHGVRAAEVTSGGPNSEFQHGIIESRWLEDTPLSLLQAELIQRFRLLQYRGVLRTLIERSRDEQPWHWSRETGEFGTDELGFRGQKPKLARLRKANSHRLHQYKRNLKPKSFRRVDQELTRMNELCKTRGVQYVLVNMPEHPDRFGRKQGPAVFAAYHEHVRAWAKSNGVPLVDITDGKLNAFANDDYYADYQHYSKEGAMHFTALLAERFAQMMDPERQRLRE